MSCPNTQDGGELTCLHSMSMMIPGSVESQVCRFTQTELAVGGPVSAVWLGRMAHLWWFAHQSRTKCLFQTSDIQVSI